MESTKGLRIAPMIVPRLMHVSRFLPVVAVLLIAGLLVYIGAVFNMDFPKFAGGALALAAIMLHHLDHK